MVMFIKKRNYIFILVLALFGLALSNIITANAKSNNIEYEKEISVRGKNISIKYEKDINSLLNNNIVAYMDDEGNEYALKGDKIIGILYKKNEMNLSNNTMQNEDINPIEVLSKDSDINLDEYVLNKKVYNKTYNETTYTYSKYINNIETNDSVILSINSDGSLSSFLIPKEGMFDNLKTSVTTNDVIKYIDEQIKKEYKNIKYEIKYMMIDYQDNKYVVDSLVSLDFEKYHDTINIIYDL